MISTASEDLIAFNRVPQHLQKTFGHKVHIASVYRWVNRGLGGVRLETIKVGAKRFTSAQALDRLFNGATKPKSEHSEAVTADLKTRNDKRIENEAKRLGI